MNWESSMYHIFPDSLLPFLWKGHRLYAISCRKDNIFMVPLKKGIRLAVCSVSKKKIHGLAAKIKATLDAVGAKQ